MLKRDKKFWNFCFFSYTVTRFGFLNHFKATLTSSTAFLYFKRSNENFQYFIKCLQLLEHFLGYFKPFLLYFFFYFIVDFHVKLLLNFYPFWHFYNISCNFCSALKIKKYFINFYFNLKKCFNNCNEFFHIFIIFEYPYNFNKILVMINEKFPYNVSKYLFVFGKQFTASYSYFLKYLVTLIPINSSRRIFNLS